MSDQPWSDPLGGSEDVATLPSGSTNATDHHAPAQGHAEPFKIVGQIIAAKKNADGEIVGEYVFANCCFYAAQFSEISRMVADAWESRGAGE